MNKNTVRLLISFIVAPLGFIKLFSMDQQIPTLPSDIWQNEIYTKLDPITVGRLSITCKQQQKVFNNFLAKTLERHVQNPIAYTQIALKYPSLHLAQKLTEYYKKTLKNQKQRIHVIKMLEASWNVNKHSEKPKTKFLLQTPLFSTKQYPHIEKNWGYYLKSADPIIQEEATKMGICKRSSYCSNFTALTQVPRVWTCEPRYLNRLHDAIKECDLDELCKVREEIYRKNYSYNCSDYDDHYRYEALPVNAEIDKRKGYLLSRNILNYKIRSFFEPVRDFYKSHSFAIDFCCAYAVIIAAVLLNK